MPRELSRQEFDAIAARVAQSAPADLSRQQFDDLIAAEAMKASGYEAPLTRERRAPGAPSALGAGHHPDVKRDMEMSPFSRAIGEAGETFGRWSNDNLPALASAGTALVPGAGVPMMAGAGAAGAAAREGIRRVVGEGRPMTGQELGLDVLKEGAISGGLPAVLGAARVAGPAIAKHAGAISNTASALSGVGAGIASGSPFTGIGMGTATKMLTNPRLIKGAGNLAARGGKSPTVNAIANKVGPGVNAARMGADAYRQALLDALGKDPASTVP